ncbi:MAG: hypothetical protein LBM98_04750 [Oscillospiraceae bacterium]|nr:hypothetical protein [Oscillospiraceae bacterium]
MIRVKRSTQWTSRGKRVGRAKPCPPAHCAGETTPPLRGHPSTEGIGVWTRVTGLGKLGAARNDGAPGRGT